ncbi:Guanine nucleotide exchange factor lte1 [Kalmusia sp. IMI 367209]|nr:Guanine nucleotide exchange factor lte1 [Kalmusia sp. IMI 367209]
MEAPSHKRAQSYPPPILVEDTASAAEPGPSMDQQTRSNTTQERPKPQTRDSFHRDRRQSTWDRGHRRQRSPNIEWHEKWTKDSWQNGRVLLIDYVGKEFLSQGRRKIVAQEFSDIDGLRKFYMNEQLSQQAALRVIHVQNASWATRFLLRKFNIDATDDLTGTNFGRWAQYERPQRRANKPVLNGKTFRAQRDPWRGISRTSFGCDYLKHYPITHPISKSESAKTTKMMQLNHYDDYDLPAHTYDVFVQRLSVYVQLSYDEPGADIDPDISNPYDEEEHQYHENLKKQYNTHDYIPKLKTLDNGNTIIIFEHSQSGSVEDTLIPARQEFEKKWRRLTFYMPKNDMENDGLMVTKCMDFIIRDIFRGLAHNWEKYSNICETHVGILEDKIYENPADEMRAPELWTNASLWLKVERLMYLHIDLIKELRNYLHELDNADPSEDQQWLESSAEEMEKLTTLFQEGVVKPTDNLSDLMYKSVGIRDARHSLQLGLSMWRLSWITFIFLPLTFVSGFFGMNVDTFSENPSIKYFVIAAVTLFAVVIVLWYMMKHTLSSQHQDTLRRGVYERLYLELSSKHPTLWTRRGPRQGIVPVGWWAGVKWRFITRWFSSDRTVLATRPDDNGDGDLGTWSRTKNYLARRWLSTLPVMPRTGATSDLDLYLHTEKPDKPTLGELMESITPVSLADGLPTAANRMKNRSRRSLRSMRSLSPARSDGERPGTMRGGSSEDGRPGSGVLVEEKGVGSDDEKSEDGRESKRTSFQERLNVPPHPGVAGA